MVADFLPLGAAHHRAQAAVGIGRVAGNIGSNLLDGDPNRLFIVIGMHQRARQRIAGLSCIAHHVSDIDADSLCEVRSGEDDTGGLATEFQGYPLDIGAGK